MLARKVALITGAAQGIGLATTRLLLNNGARVSMLDINEKVGNAACSSLQKEFPRDDVMFITTNVTKNDQLRLAFEKTKEKFGGIDIVCNNAGIGNETKWKKTIEVNLMAMIEGTYLGLEYMSTSKGGKGGTIINVSSMAGIIPMSYGPVYTASKHGVVGFTRTLRNLAADESVRVNCICPEFTETAMVQSMMSDSTTTSSFESGAKETTELVQKIGLLQPEQVAEGILQLITDVSKAGAVMTVTLRRGITYYTKLPGEPKSHL